MLTAAAEGEEILHRSSEVVRHIYWESEKQQLIHVQTDGLAEELWKSGLLAEATATIEVQVLLRGRYYE